MQEMFDATHPGKFLDREAYLRNLAAQKEPLNIQLTNNYAFQKVFKNKTVAKGFLMALLHLDENEIVDLEITDPFAKGENDKEKEGILDVKIYLNHQQTINLEMQNQFQADWKERSLFYNCRMFTSGFQKGNTYGMLVPCIHVGILNFTLLQRPGFHHCFQLMERQSHEIYSDKFLMHVIQLTQLDVAPKREERELHRWATLIAAKDWKEVQMAAKGNMYMETALDEMEKINMNENERYLYLRRQMAEADMASMISWANKEGRKEGKTEIVLHMLDQGLACENISKLTNLPLSEVIEAKKQREQKNQNDRSDRL